MQLKRIILKGFKSFPDKTTLDFDDGVTAIVGPNGSGKSNIIEAIRWVMGEQSAKTLRGDRMNDIIFAGTREKKALNIAEVELILDNSSRYLDSEYDELSILRRLSRNGQSTYMINKKECRLKDIVDLFMDSGLGKESFSVISQGEVEAIFNSKPEDRRGIFEEAAGVFKYKVRKEDAKKKMIQTEDNLDRVQDILYELESQVEPLRMQADIAKSYLDQKEKLTDLDISVSARQIEELHKELKSDKDKKQTLIMDLDQIKQTLEKLEREKENTQSVLDRERTRVEDLNTKLVTIVREKERVEASLNLFDEKSRHQKEFVREKERSIAELEGRNQSEQAQLNKIKQVYAKEKENLDQILLDIKKLEKQRNRLEGDKEEQMENLRNQYIDYLQKQSSLKNEQTYLEQELSRSQSDYQRVDQQVKKLEDAIKEQELTLQEAKLEYEDIQKELKKLNTEHQKVGRLLRRSRQSLTITTERLTERANELERVKARALSLTELQENYSGYYAGVRAVMQNKDQLAGIIGTVAELLTIPNDYLLAINTVLGSSGQFIVVENEANARSAINYLKNKRKGRATFLPLTTIKPRKLSSSQKNKLKEMPGYLGIANELVGNNVKIQNIIDNLLGHTIVAENLEDANKIARAIQFRNRVVSTEGDVIHAGGSMTGGGQQNNLNPVFSQKAELGKLQEFIQENEPAVERLRTRQKQERQEQKELEEKVEVIRTAGERKRFTEQELKNNIENLKQMNYRLQRELEATSFEVQDQQELEATYQKRLQKTKASLLEVEELVTSVNESMRVLTSEQENIESEKEKITSKIEDIHETRNTLRENLARDKMKIEHITKQLKDNDQQIEKLHLDIKSFEDGEPLESKEALQETFKDYQYKEKELESNQIKARTNIQKTSKYLEELVQQTNQLSGQITYLNDQKSAIDIRLSKNDVRIDYLLEYLAEEYKVSYEEARLHHQENIDLADAKKQVRLLNKGIKELGPVNLNSIEEFESVNERYQFLNKQQSDLIEAKETLFSTMDEMDLIVEKYFKETFDQVQEEFAKVFPKMFGGGYAELVLSDPDNLLETGIEIIAQPPGKKLTQLSLLSGGERALTAISLLFAIIQVNPIPFCILDEAESALDDANVVRFGQYLQDFENDTQFILITHRKGTMEHSDQLYGITMQEKGISKVVGVSLREAQEIKGLT